jgi:hypothetical protein
MSLGISLEVKGLKEALRTINSIDPKLRRAYGKQIRELGKVVVGFWKLALLQVFQMKPASLVCSILLSVTSLATLLRLEIYLAFEPFANITSMESKDSLMKMAGSISLRNMAVVCLFLSCLLPKVRS